MKKKVSFLLPVVLLLVLLACKKTVRETSTTFTLEGNAANKAGDTLTGFFTASGDPTTSGNFIMGITQVGDSLHCNQVLDVTGAGTITIHSDCSNSASTGAWYIVTGTGKYANLRGKGLLTMPYPPGNPYGIEALQGKTWRE